MNLTVALRLGRVSNLPTVWTNTLAGAALAGVSSIDSRLLWPMLAMSMAYIGGMYLNDAFDRNIDAIERPERPIPAGQVQAWLVFGVGFSLLAGAVLVTAYSAGIYGVPTAMPVLAAASLAAAIVLYNIWHKSNPLSPLVMGVCRVLVYFSVALTVITEPATQVSIGAALLLGWLIGLTYTAKQENLGVITNAWPLLPLIGPLLYGVLAASQTPLVWLPSLLLAALLAYALWRLRRRGAGDVPVAVTTLIAGIALVDAILIATAAAPGWVILAVLACPLTLALQRIIPGT